MQSLPRKETLFPFEDGWRQRDPDPRDVHLTCHFHVDDRNHGLAWTKPNNGIYNTQNSQQTCA